MPDSFLKHSGNYKRLKVYQVAEIIYDISYYFSHKYFGKGDRTIDQMIQAARSGKQNIVEGNEASSTSKETRIKLTNVAKASFKELLEDYEDYLRVRNLEIWDKDSEKAVMTRKFCVNHNDSKDYRDRLDSRSAETIANIAIILLHQEDVMLQRFIESQKKDFLENGGMREEMFRKRQQYRNSNNPQKK